jgi:hypothetical protein
VTVAANLMRDRARKSEAVFQLVGDPLQTVFVRAVFGVSLPQLATGLHEGENLTWMGTVLPVESGVVVAGHDNLQFLDRLVCWCDVIRTERAHCYPQVRAVLLK